MTGTWSRTSARASGTRRTACRGRGPHVARRATSSRTGKPYVCPNCKNVVEPGQRCVDHAGLYADDDRGFFGRFHAECFELMERWAKKMCGGDWCWPFDIHAASEHAMAHADEEFWRDWLLLYEQTWAFGPGGE